MQENQLQRHKREFHDEEKIICDFCGKEFVTLSGFKQHMRLFHPSEAIVIPDRYVHSTLFISVYNRVHNCNLFPYLGLFRLKINGLSAISVVAAL